MSGLYSKLPVMLLLTTIMTMTMSQKRLFFVIECSAHPSPDQVTTGYLRFSNPLSSITIQFCKSLCLMRANELCRISILSSITWQFGVNSLISTDDALRRPTTYDNHPSRVGQSVESALIALAAIFLAHSAYFNNFRQKIPYFDASRQKRVLFNCFATKQCLGMLKM